MRKSYAAIASLAVLAAVAGSRAQPGVFLDEVVLYVTRHALSCANIVSHWPASKSGVMSKLAPNRKVRDPMLCNAGVVGSKSTGEVLAQRFQPGDAPQFVLSSVLLRAVETAMLQYPGRETIHVVPHMREFSKFSGSFSKFMTGSDKDNLPNPFDTQQQLLSDLHGKVPSIQNWVGDDEREQPGDWPKFIEFLGTSFLPKQATHVNQSRVVLAVVTHSNFIAKSLTHCKKHWNSKPLNNQVVRIRYTVQLSLNNTYHLVPTDECENVVSGISYVDENDHYKGLCISDIGEPCLKKLRESGVASPDTVEDKISGLEGEMKHAGEQMRVAFEKLAKAGAQSTKDVPIKGKKAVGELGQKIDTLKATTCLTGQPFKR